MITKIWKSPSCRIIIFTTAYPCADNTIFLYISYKTWYEYRTTSIETHYNILAFSNIICKHILAFFSTLVFVYYTVRHKRIWKSENLLVRHIFFFFFFFLLQFSAYLSMCVVCPGGFYTWNYCAERNIENARSYFFDEIFKRNRIRLYFELPRRQFATTSTKSTYFGFFFFFIHCSIVCV